MSSLANSERLALKANHSLSFLTLVSFVVKFTVDVRANLFVPVCQ